MLLSLASVANNSAKVIIFDGWDEYAHFDEVLQAFDSLRMTLNCQTMYMW
jgi:hypothetical protein